VKSTWIFRGAVTLSIAAHAVLLAMGGEGASAFERVIEIPVVLEDEPPAPPPPPPASEEPPEKERPRNLARRIRKVVEGDGLRTGDLVDAEVGEYSETVAAEPPPPLEPLPAKPTPKPASKPEIDRVKLAREFLAVLRSRISASKEYPVAAQRMGLTGSVTVSFVVGPDSYFHQVAVKRSSGHEVLDRAALSAVSKLSGEVLRPAELGVTDLKTSIVLRYLLNG